MARIWTSTLLGIALLTPAGLTTTVLRAQDQRYHDEKHQDDHVWNDSEDRAYHQWVKETHRKDREFAKLNKRDQQSYWDWRHDHPDKDDRH